MRDEASDTISVGAWEAKSPAQRAAGAHLARVDEGTSEREGGVSDGSVVVTALPDGAAPDRGPGALGVVFLEDILEELVGEVRDAMQRRVH